LHFLFARQTNLFRIYDDHEITGIDVRGENCFPFSAKKISHCHRDTAERTILRVNDVPFPLYPARLG